MKYSRSAAIIIDNKKILLMFRRKYGREYFCLPGGTIEQNETPKQTVIREVKEETNLDIKVEESPIFEFEDSDGISYCYYFKAESFKGNLELGGEEREKCCRENYYELRWVDLKKLEEINLQPKELFEKLKNFI